MSHDFDVPTGILTAFDKGIGLAYCSDSYPWRWDGHDFILTDTTFPFAYGRSISGDWPVLYRSEVAQGKQKAE